MNNYLSLLKTTEYSILEEITSIFEKNGISYFLACGTLLGAVRHKGFIPWDDDIDIYCYGRDYDRIVNALSSCQNLRFCDSNNSDDYPYWFPKVIYKNSFLVEKELINNGFKCGVYVDLFFLMELPNDKKKAKRIEKKRYFYYGLLKAYYLEKKTFFSWMIKRIAHIFCRPRKIYQKLLRLYGNDFSSDFFIDTGVFGRQALLKKEDFKEYVYLPFENGLFRAPKGYDNYLSNYYGAYMKLPKKEDRISCHNIVLLEIDGNLLIDER